MTKQLTAKVVEHNLSDRFDKIIESLMTALLIFMPLALGVVYLWSELGVIALAGIMALCFSLKFTLAQSCKLIWTRAYVPVLLFLLLVVGQLIPLPASVVQTLTPETYQVKMSLSHKSQDNELVSPVDSAGILMAPNSRETMSISLDPDATQHDLRLILSISVVFLVIINVYRKPEQILRLLKVIMIIGFGVGLLTLVQHIMATDKMYWIFPTPRDRVFSGPFLDRHYFSQFMNLSIGAALGLMLVRVHEVFKGKDITLANVVDHLGDVRMRLVWLCLVMIILSAVLIFLSFNHGGMISMLIAGSVTALVIAWKRGIQGHGWIIILLMIGSLVGIFYIGYLAVFERLEPLHEMELVESDNQPITEDILAWTKFPLTGTGLGADGATDTTLDQSDVATAVGVTENEYFQILEETGIIGLVLIVIFGVIIWQAYIKDLRFIGKKEGNLPIRSAAFGLGYGLLAIMIHSLFNLGQHLPANAVLTAVTCGLLVGLVQLPKRTPTGVCLKSTNQPTKILPLRMITVLGWLGLWLWAISGAFDALSKQSRGRVDNYPVENQPENNMSAGTNGSMSQPTDRALMDMLNIDRD